MPRPDKQAVPDDEYNFHPHRCPRDADWTPMKSWCPYVDTRLGKDVDCLVKAL